VTQSRKSAPSDVDLLTMQTAVLRNVEISFSMCVQTVMERILQDIQHGIENMHPLSDVIINHEIASMQTICLLSARRVLGSGAGNEVAMTFDVLFDANMTDSAVEAALKPSGGCHSLQDYMSVSLWECSESIELKLNEITDEAASCGTGCIAAIVVAVMCLQACIALIYCIIKRSKREKRYTSAPDSSDDSSSQDSSEDSTDQTQLILNLFEGLYTGVSDDSSS